MATAGKLTWKIHLALGAAILCCGLFSPALAAEDHNSSRSNKSGNVDASGDGDADKKLAEESARLDNKIDSLNSKLDELTRLLSTIEEQTAQARALQTEIDTLSEEAIVLTGQVTAQRKDMLQWYQDSIDKGREVFEAEVAPFLDADVVAAVQQKLEYMFQNNESDLEFLARTEGIGDGLGGLGALVDGLSAALEQLQSTAESHRMKVRDSWPSGR